MYIRFYKTTDTDKKSACIHNSPRFRVRKFLNNSINLNKTPIFRRHKNRVYQKKTIKFQKNI